MAKYIAKRVALALVTLVIVSMLTFFLMFLVPGGPFLSEKSPSPAVLAAMEEKYGLDKPVIVQYKNYMLNLLQGELGPSIKQRGRTVAQIIGSRFPVSARIGGIALAIAVVVGVVLGSVAALNRGKWIDNVIIVIATCGIAVPSFVVCTILLYIFSLKLGWLPSYGLTGWKNYIMPVIALGFYPTAYICRLMCWGRITCAPPAPRVFPRARACLSMRCAMPFCLSSLIWGRLWPIRSRAA